MNLPWELIASLAGLLVLSALFSGSETALFSIPIHRLRRIARSSRADERAVGRAMKDARGTLVTLLIGNMVANILASAVASSAVLELTGGSGWALGASTVTMTILLLVFGEIAPKTVAYHHAEPIARFVARPLILLGHVLFPLRVPLVRLTNAILGEESRHDGTVEMEEVDTMVYMAHEEGEVDDEERDILLGVIELGSSPLEDVMTPRTEIFSLPGDLPVGEARGLVFDAGFSKIPVSTAAPDEMAGFVTATDLLLADDDQWLGSLASPVEYVPEVKPAVDLLADFQASGRRLAFVVDEHGHLSGLVTLTDLLEEISGEMVESGDVHKVLYERVGKNRVIIPGRMEVRFFNEQFGTSLSTDDSETMAGLVLERIGRIPDSGDSFVIDRLGVTVLKAEPHRIVSLEIVLPEEETGKETP
ncbi:MAG: membrane protein [Gemmatimonadota bacterium]|nr:MAG: membrane protein [Gemmatimonadota bacterium]